jgi:hypothetical protein
MLCQDCRGEDCREEEQNRRQTKGGKPHNAPRANRTLLLETGDDVTLGRLEHTPESRQKAY